MRTTTTGTTTTTTTTTTTARSKLALENKQQNDKTAITKTTTADEILHCPFTTSAVKPRHGAPTCKKIPTIEHTNFWSHEVQLNPAIAHFKGLAKIVLSTEVFIIANVKITMKIVIGTKILCALLAELC